jgi:excisionase family DNA binding protein
MVISGKEKKETYTVETGTTLPARLLSVGEVARFLGVHSSTVRRWGKKGLLKSYTIGLRNNLRFKQEDVLNLLIKYKM